MKNIKVLKEKEIKKLAFPVEKYLRRISARFPKKNLRSRFSKAFEQNDRKKADQMLHELYAEADSDKKQTKAVGQVSHVLSERFSRDPVGWSEECLGKLSQSRVYLKNGGKLTREDFKEKDENISGKERYGEYGERMMKEAVEGCFDWSIFPIKILL